MISMQRQPLRNQSQHRNDDEEDDDDIKATYDLFLKFGGRNAFAITALDPAGPHAPQVRT